MGRPLRLLEPDGIYFITARCLQARMLMRPDKRVTDIIGGVLARAIARFGVEVFAVSFVSNHFHLIVRSAADHIPDFMQYLRCNIAKKVGAVRNWHGKFWDRRYDAEPILDDAALEARLRYVVSHGVEEGLVSSCLWWPPSMAVAPDTAPVTSPQLVVPVPLVATRS